MLIEDNQEKCLDLFLDLTFPLFLLFPMAETTNKQSHTKHHHKNEPHTFNTDDETMINAILSYEHNFGDQLKQLEHDAGIHSQEMELNECLLYIVQLVELFKHTVITSDLENKHDWDEHHRHQLKSNKGFTGDHFLDHQMETIALTKGLSKEQWNRLLYLTLTTTDTVEITNVSKKHLQKVHDMSARLLESDQQKGIFALINAIEKHMPEKYFTHN
jgi:hypothetical protein